MFGPYPPTPDATYNGGSDAFILLFNPEAHWIDYSSYLGGAGNEENISLTFDASGSLYAIGATQSHDFPTHDK